MEAGSQYPYGRAWTKARDMAGDWLFSCPDHTSDREATDYMAGTGDQGNHWQMLDIGETPPRGCDLCASEERMFGPS